MESNYIFEYKVATEDELVEIWDKNILINSGDDHWTVWKDRFIRDNREDKAKTFLVICNGRPVGEGTLLLSPKCEAIRGRILLSDGESVANINALRIEKAYEGRGHISKLIKTMEQWAKDNGYTCITIGVEESQRRSHAIYQHRGV